jgi:outer membrane protein OmpA-like peptidoglycan-associated protein
MPNRECRISTAVLFALISAWPASPQDTTAQPDLKSTRIEFVPGERTIFYDDFSDMAPDEPPPHWKVRDAKVDLKVGGSVRELYAGGDTSPTLTSPAIAVPQNFTMELVWTGNGEMVWHFADKDGQNMINAVVRGEEDGQTVNIQIEAKDQTLGEGTFMADTSKPVTFALSAQQGRVRGYVNGERLIDANQVEFNPITRLEVELGRYRPNGIRSVRVAESAPDFSSIISSTGKVVTHGILFDTDSDKLKPESAAVLKQVASALLKNPNLKLEIDGYTDSSGDATRNVDLSKRRARAVSLVLVSQFGIESGRLDTNGFGAGNPIASNDTATGRAANRRVEFLKK